MKFIEKTFDASLSSKPVFTFKLDFADIYENYCADNCDCDIFPAYITVYYANQITTNQICENCDNPLTPSSTLVYLNDSNFSFHLDELPTETQNFINDYVS
jgi:hypothetical protein